MASIQFNQLWILSKKSQAGRMLTFSPTTNIITSNDNTVGKSTVLKMMLWTLGCEPEFKDEWNIKNISSCLTFSIGKRNFLAYRADGIIAIKEDGKKWNKWDKITGDYSVFFSKLVNYHVLLDDRNNENTLITPPPAFYFLPYYIDQSKSWKEPWNSFRSLNQFSNWQEEIIKSHIGLLPPNYYKTKEDKYKLLREASDIEVDINDTKKGLSIIDKYVSNKISVIPSTESIDRSIDEIRLQMQSLQESEEKQLLKYSSLVSGKTTLKYQSEAIRKQMLELDKDYQFSVKYASPQVVCPTCGNHYRNDIIHRSGILLKKDELKHQLQHLEEKLVSINNKISEVMEELNNTRVNISEIEDRYVKVEQDDILVKDYLKIIGQLSIKESIIIGIENQEEQFKAKNIEVAQLTKQLKSIISKERKDEIKNYYISTANSHLSKLSLETIDEDKVKKFSKFNCLVGGGAADDIRSYLAFYLAIYKSILRFSNETSSPMLIDSPNQQEQSQTNYQAVLDLILSCRLHGEQLFLCAMNNDTLQGVLEREDVNTIWLNSQKHLLNTEQYDIVREYLDKIKASIS